MRPTRKKLKFDEESVNDLLQEIYNDSHNLKAKITRLFTKWETKVKEAGEVQAIGDQIVKLIAAEAKNQDQKIVLLRYLKEVVFENKLTENGDGKKTSENNENVSTNRRNELIEWIQSEAEKNKSENK